MAVGRFSPGGFAGKQKGEGTTKSVYWHALRADEVLERLAAVAETGLTSEEAERRLKTYGPNKIVEAPALTFWKLLWGQFNNFVVILLIAAAFISALLSNEIEAVAILAIVILNAALGIIQEQRAERALTALRQLTAPDAHVIRDASRKVIPASQLVPGDIVLLESGNYIPADLRLLETFNLRIDEATLTGESVAIQKDAGARLESDLPLGDQKNTAFMGTMASFGRGKGIVVATGMLTQMGMIAQMLQAVDQENTPLQRRLDGLGKTLGWISIAVCVLVFFMGWLRGNNPLEMFLIAVSLAIAAVPEGLPAVVTISLALGMREMIKRHALIRRLSSVETLGSATVICSDKTGTLTQNEMTATRLWVAGQSLEISGRGYIPQGEFSLDGRPIDILEYPAALTALWVSVLNNDASLETSASGDDNPAYRLAGDPTEGALIVAAAKAGAQAGDIDRSYPRIQEIPFDSIRKRMVTVHRIQNPRPEDFSPIYDQTKHEWYAITVKGAPDVVLNLCSYYQCLDDQTAVLDEGQKARILAANDEMTQNALRVLGLAYRITPKLPDLYDPGTTEKGLVFAGLIGMIDPPRPEVQPALKKASRAGIRTIMITGDYPNTARAIAETIGLLHGRRQVLTGADLNQLDENTLRSEVARTDVFARVSPEHKLRIVEALRANGEVVAMTGDGVNDAPSIKRADIGIAMGITGTDVAKGSADMVLTDDNYASIVAAVEQGRVIYSNIRKFVYYLLSCNLAEITIIFLGTLVGRGSPLTAIQLLWLNLITDGAPALALGTERGDPDIMERPPRPSSEPIINRSMIGGIVVQTVALTAVTLGAYFAGLAANPSQAGLAHTMAFITLSLSEMLRAYTARSERYPLLRMHPFSNRNMNLGVLSSIVLMLAVVYFPPLNPVFNTVPLGWPQWRLILPLLIVPSIAAEAMKWLSRRRLAA